MKNKRNLTKLLALSLVPISLVLMVSVQPGEAVAPGVTFVVNSTADLVDAAPGNGVCATAGGACTLRAAIMEANAFPGDDTVDFAPSVFGVSQTIKLRIPGVNEDYNATGDLDITGDLTIIGRGANLTTIDADGIDRVFDIRPDNPTNVRILGLRVTGGKTLSPSPGGGSGGGIITHGGRNVLTLTSVTVDDNQADNGGGIFVGGPVTLNNCTVSNNTALTGSFGGGGILNYINGGLTLNNSTVTGNRGNWAGGIMTTSHGPTLILNNSTVSFNSGGLYHSAGTAILKNTILANNGGSGNCRFPNTSALTSLGHNLSTDNSCAAPIVNVTGGLDPAKGDLNNTPAQLAPLALNSPGSTMTHALLPGSPAIDKGSDCLAVDQRGVPRPQGAACDIGAYEVGAASCALRPSEMVGWWPLDGLNSDGKYDDIAGGDNNGTPKGNPSQIPNEYVGNSLQAGTEKYVEVPDATNLNFGHESFTIDAWVKYTPGTDTEPIVYKLGNLAGYFMYLSTSTFNGPVDRLYLQIGSQLYPGPQFNVPIGTWIFVAARISKSNFNTGTVDLYVGVPGSPLKIANHPAGAFTAASHGTPLQIGRWPFNPNASLGIDEVEIFSRALNEQAEIQSIFEAGSVGKCKPTCLNPPPSGMVAWWPLDETQGSQVVHDLAGGHDGTPMGFGGAVTTIGATGGPKPVTGFYVDNSLLFEGSHVEVPDSPDLNFGMDGKDPFTIDAWINYYPLRQTRPIVSKLASFNGPGYFLSIEPAGLGVFKLTLQIDGVKYIGPPVPPSTWVFVAATRNASGVKLYVGHNNTLTPIPHSGSPANASSEGTPLWIGQQQGPNNVHPTAEIDEVEIFNRALDEPEIDAIFRADWAGKCKSAPGKGTIIIRKNSEGGINTFGYTTGAGLSAFSITTSGGTGSQRFIDIEPGLTTVTEASPPPGWVFTDLVCSDPDGGTTVSGQTANIDLDRDETVICTYTNTKCPTVTWTPAAGALPPPSINTPYSQVFKATGGCAPSVIYSLTSGALPNGLKLTADGVLSGTATNPGTYDFTVTATDSCGCSQSQTYTLTASVHRGDFPFTRGMNEFCIWGGGGPFNSPTPSGSPTPINAFTPPETNTRGARFGSIGLCYGRILSANDRFALKYTFNAIPVAGLSYSDVNRVFAPGFPVSFLKTRRNVFGAGFSPIGFQLYFRPQRRIKPFINTSGGFIAFSDPVPLVNGARFNFTYDFGSGVQVFRDPRRAFTFGYKYQRISSGGRALNNPGFNGHVFHFGYSIFQAPKHRGDQ